MAKIEIIKNDSRKFIRYTQTAGNLETTIHINVDSIIEFRVRKLISTGAISDIYITTDKIAYSFDPMPLNGGAAKIDLTTIVAWLEKVIVLNENAAPHTVPFKIGTSSTAPKVQGGLEIEHQPTGTP